MTLESEGCEEDLAPDLGTVLMKTPTSSKIRKEEDLSRLKMTKLQEKESKYYRCHSKLTCFIPNEIYTSLEEHELEQSQLDQHEEQEKKNNNISLKAKIEKYESSEDEDEKEETDDMSLFVKKFSKFLRRNKGTRTGQIKKFTKSNEAYTSNQNFTCFECGKPGHMKMGCLNIKKGFFKGKNEMKNGRRAYIAWEDNDTCSASEPKSEEQAQLSLMASHHSDDEEVNESNSFSSSKLYSAFNDMHDEYMKLTKIFLKQKYELDALRSKPSSSSCQNCFTLKEKVSTLSLELNKMNKSNKSLSKIINDLRHSTDRRGLGYSNGPTLKMQSKSAMIDFQKSCIHTSTHSKN
ncbi:hypothetical protein Lal_00044187 [Lupinus albus]|nr:hypothetical protein Lal_00044187 [Lupinus albus]